MKKKSIFLILAIVCCNVTVLLSQSPKDVNDNDFKTTKINTQTWMSENLNVSHFQNGDSIPQAKTEAEWAKAGKEARPVWCYYNYDAANGVIYGKLYNWYAISDPRGIAPVGWHVPTTDDWKGLVTYLGGIMGAGTNLKNSSGWNSNGNGKNVGGFAGLPGGQCFADGKCKDLGDEAFWWTSSIVMYGNNQVFSFSLTGSRMNVFYLKQNKDVGLSVRCIKDI